MDVSPRRSLRIPLPVESVRADDRQCRFLGYLENVSATGLFIQCTIPRAVGTKLELRLRVPGAPEPLCVTAEVIWTRGYCGRKGPAPGMGLRFIELAREPLGEIRKFCEESDPRIHPIVADASKKKSSSS